jgi:hypothetical protein
MENYSGTLKSISKLKTELIYDESEFSIQRDINLYSVIVVLFCLLIGNLIMNIYNNFNEFPLRNNPEKVWIYSYLVISILLILSTSLAFYPLMKYRKKNRKVYKYESIENIRVEEMNDRIQISFKFLDNSEDEIKLSKNELTLSFIESLRGKNVGFIDD